MSVVEQEKLSMAGALLDKARSSNFPREQEALAVRAYTLLAGYLNSIDPDDEVGRRRERRLLKDRRIPSARHAAPSGQQPPTSPLPAQYRNVSGAHRPVGVRLDVTL